MSEQQFCTYCGRRLIEEFSWRHNRRELWRLCPRYRMRWVLFPNWDKHSLVLVTTMLPPLYDPITGERRDA